MGFFEKTHGAFHQQFHTYGHGVFIQIKPGMVVGENRLIGFARPHKTKNTGDPLGKFRKILTGQRGKRNDFRF